MMMTLQAITTFWRHVNPNMVRDTTFIYHISGRARVNRHFSSPPTCRKMCEHKLVQDD